MTSGRTISVGLCLMISVGLSGCTFHFDWIDKIRAQRAVANQNYETAVNILYKLMQADPDAETALYASRMGSTVAHINAKDYVKAVEFFKHIVLKSPDPEERKSAQRFIAQIEFENLHEYDKAVVDYEKLLQLDLTPAEAFRYRMNLGKSHFYLNNIDQAIEEINAILKKSKSPEELFEARVLKANTEVAAKRLKEAAEQWKAIIRDFPDRAKKENISLNLAVVQEDMGEFEEAISVLENMRPGYAQPEYLDLRIQRLKDRRENQPGAHGLRK
jgi:tetratricopeptide (TPR) repeat protein